MILGSSNITSSTRFIYDTNSGGLFFDSDGNGAAAQVKIATLNNAPFISNTDIIVI